MRLRDAVLKEGKTKGRSWSRVPRIGDDERAIAAGA
jgi:hypothetical protein